MGSSAHWLPQQQGRRTVPHLGAAATACVNQWEGGLCHSQRLQDPVTRARPDRACQPDSEASANLTPVKLVDPSVPPAPTAHGSMARSARARRCAATALYPQLPQPLSNQTARTPACGPVTPLKVGLCFFLPGPAASQPSRPHTLRNRPTQRVCRRASQHRWQQCLAGGMPVALQCSAAAQQAAAGSGLRAVKAGAQRGGSDGGTPPRRSRLQFLYDVAQRTFNQPTEPTDQQIQALRLTLSEWGRRWGGARRLHSRRPAAAWPPPHTVLDWAPLRPAPVQVKCLWRSWLCRSGHILQAPLPPPPPAPPPPASTRAPLATAAVRELPRTHPWAAAAAAGLSWMQSQRSRAPPSPI